MKQGLELLLLLILCRYLLCGGFTIASLLCFTAIPEEHDLIKVGLVLLTRSRFRLERAGLLRMLG